MERRLKFKETVMKIGSKSARVLMPIGPPLSDEEAWKMMKPILSRINRRLEKNR